MGYHLHMDRINKSFRIESGLNDLIQVAADKSGRSFHEEAIQRLRESFEQPELIERIRVIIEGDKKAAIDDLRRLIREEAGSG